MESSGLANEKGVAGLTTTLQADISSPGPLACAIVGGGEWGPRVVAKALLESVLVDWVNDVYLLDVKDIVEDFESDVALDEAQTWMKRHLCKAIERCPGKAVVVLDNVHLLEGEGLRVLDTMLSLADGHKSNMECNDQKVSGEGSLLVLLLNEDGPAETRQMDGKERLRKAWDYQGPEFTTRAFLGRIDAAVSLSQKLSDVPEGMEAAWGRAKAMPRDNWGLAIIEAAKDELAALDSGTVVKAVAGVVAIAVIVGVVNLKRPPQRLNQVGPAPDDDDDDAAR